MKNNIWTLLIDLSLVVGLCAVPADAEVLLSHSGSADPVGEGWIQAGPGAGSSAGPYTSGNPPADAWFVEDTSDANGSGYVYYQNLEECSQAHVDEYGWTMRACVLVDDPNVVDNGSVSSWFGYNAGDRRYDIWFTNDDAGNTWVWLMTDNPPTCGPEAFKYQVSTSGSCDAPGFHLFELSFDASSQSADLSVDGVVLHTGYTGSVWGLEVTVGIGWGAGSSCGDGWAAFHSIAFEAPGPVLSSEAVRLGIPSNPDVFRPGITTGPVTGRAWDPIVDHSGFAPNATLDVLAVDLGPPINVPSEFGTLLCSLSSPGLLFYTAPGSPFEVHVPGSCSFVGVSLCSQAASLTGTNIQLTNALDLVIGSQ